MPFVPDMSEPALQIVAEAPPAPRRSVLRRWLDLLWSEWFAHNRLLFFFLALWLGVVWFVPLFAHPLWILAIGPIVAVVAGPVLGGSDILRGCEEYFMAFPVRRSERFLSRALLGGVAVVALSLASALSLVNNLSDVLLRVFISTGLPQTNVTQPGLLYGLVLAVPFAAFCLSFSTACLAPTRTLALVSWLWGALGALAVLRLGLYIEESKYEKFDGRFATPILIMISVASMFIASRLYSRKEAAAGTTPLRVPLSGWIWLLVLAAASLATGLLVEWFASNVARLF